MSSLRKNQYSLITLSIIIFLIILFISLLSLVTFQKQLMRDQTIESAQVISSAIQEFRTVYTSEVVEKAVKQGIQFSHDYDETPNKLPLPATLSKLLGDRIGLREHGAKFGLYSNYPFPWRKNEINPSDPFRQDAWKQLSAKPNKPFFRFEDSETGPVLRYATADLMREACVRCHNSHPQTPKNDWKEGDLRGIVEVTLPLRHLTSDSSFNLKLAAAVLLLIISVLFTLVVLLISRMRHTAQLLEQSIVYRTSDLQQEKNLRERDDQHVMRMESKMAYMRRLTFLGRIAHSVVQQLNTTLTPSMEPPAVQAKTLLNQLLCICESENGENENINLVSSSEELLAICRSFITSTTELNLTTKIQEIFVHINLFEYYQLLIKLITQADQTIQNSNGKIDIQLSIEQINEPQELTNFRINQGSYAVICIKDNGTGMNEQSRQQFLASNTFANKQVDVYGLSWAEVLHTVKDVQGGIDLQSETGKGGTFMLYLPIADMQD